MFRISQRTTPPIIHPLVLFAQKVFVLVGIVTVMYVAWLAWSVIALFIAAILGAIILSPAITSLERRRVPTWLAILIAYTFLTIFVALIAFAVTPLVIDSVTRILALADGRLRALQDWITSFALTGSGGQITKDFAKQLSTNNVLPFLREHLAGLSAGAGNALGTGWGILSATLSAVVSMGLAAVLGFVILVERRSVWRFVLDVLPSSTSQYIASRTPCLGGIITGWLRGQALVGLSITIMVYVGLWVLEIFGISFDNKANLAIVAGMMTFLPYIGSVIALLPAIAFALSLGGWAPLIGVAAVYGVAQFLEGNIIGPFVMGRSLHVSPLLTFCVMLLMAALLGFVGAVLAAPTSAVIALLYQDFSARRHSSC